MRKRFVSGMFIGAAGMLVFALGTANAAVSVTIENADGSTVYSVPPLPADLAYPAEIETDITGTAGFDSIEGSVLLQFIDRNYEGDIVVFSGDAALACNETGSSCTWGFTVPFAFAPGSYDLVVTASEPNPSDPDNRPSASETIAITVL